ncbi:hypothetical protein PAUR_a3940 [Pseudoalteromonas aurantia 208]|uniref:Orphan protein n=1 Tax=Pseudoalteromonas aurantia 208 TaxID=1314867 RepID=A0ABR9EEN8_9GAMM|nr:hypothetical protein [Pseudoalteromonas aurantia 208]
MKVDYNSCEMVTFNCHVSAFVVYSMSPNGVGVYALCI